MTGPSRVLVIKLSALGDMIQAFPAFARIRAAHAAARITLLTTPPFAELARLSPYFDEVDPGGRSQGAGDFLALIRRLRRGRFDRVYDLQGNDRTNLIFQFLRPYTPMWSGVAFGCALPHANPLRMAMHTLERQAEQLQAAGIWPEAPTRPGSAPAPDVSWMIQASSPAPGPPFSLLIPGAAPSRPLKLWPAPFYAALAQRLLARGLGVKLIGGPGEAGIAAAIKALTPGVEDLAGRTTLTELADLGARAALAVGNDTGPTHLIAAAGASTLALFSGDSDPALCAPRGRVEVLRTDILADLPVDRVWDAAMQILEKYPAPKP